MMSLVAYENSDDSDTEEEEEEKQREDRDPSVSDDGIACECPGATKSAQKKSIFSDLPAPKCMANDPLEAEGDVEVKCARSSIKSTTRNANQPVKIYLEPLSEFADTEKTSKKQRVSSSAGSGLFAVLPPPKNASGKMANRVLVPHSLTRRVTNTEGKPAVKKPITTISHDEEEEDSGLPIDFFGLQSNKSQERATTSKASCASKVDIADKVLPIPNLNPVVDIDDVRDPSDMDVEAEEMDETAVDVAKAQRIEDLFQDEAFMRVRGKKRTIDEEEEIIDVSQDEQMPPWEERTKLLTQEDENAPVNKGPQPSAQHRRKHQITYLAYQAKARELELKNQWAQNHWTKQQTRAKYGF